MTSANLLFIHHIRPSQYPPASSNRLRKASIDQISCLQEAVTTPLDCSNLCQQ
jgi:hypothetical protein